MKKRSIAAAALICSLVISGCGANGINHTARSQSYQNMGNQGYHISPGQNSASTQNISGPSNLYTLTDKNIREIDIHKSHQLQAKINRAGITSYSVLVVGNTVLLGHAYPTPIKNQSTGTTSNTHSNTGTTVNTGFGSTTAPNSSPTSQRGFGTPTTPSLDGQSNSTNGVPIEQLQKDNVTNSTQGINQNVNKKSSVPVNPSHTDNGGNQQGNAREIYQARGIIEREMGKNAEIFFIHDQRGVNAIMSIKQKVNKKGILQTASIHHELRILETEINR